MPTPTPTSYLTNPETPTCVGCGRTDDLWTSPTGHRFCPTHYALIAESLQNIYGEEGPQPVDLRALLNQEPTGAEWLCEPLLPAGKLVAIVSKRGEGKSLLMLDLAANLATGQPILHQPAGPPRPGVYLDMEMGPDDLYERLVDLGYTLTHPHFDELTKNLHYYLLPSLPPLDSEAGGEALEEIVERHRAEWVVIDTISRVVAGDENDAEPYRDLYRNTETRLKRRRITLARLDHLGKDAARGSRGSSAKEDPMDVVWQMTTTAAGALVFTLTKGRQGWIPRSVTIHRTGEETSQLRHYIKEEPPPDWLLPLMAVLDELEVDPALSGNQALAILQEAKQGAHKTKVNEAQRRRRLRIVPKPTGSEKTGTTLFDENGTSDRNHSEPLPKTLINPSQNAGTTPGTSKEPVVLGKVPPIGRNHPTTDPEKAPFDLDEDYEPDPADLPDPY